MIEQSIKRKLDEARAYARDLQDRFGAWLLNYVLSTAKIVWYLASFAIFIFITTLCPYFAWASFGEHLVKNSPILLFEIAGLAIIVVPAAFFTAQIMITMWVVFSARGEIKSRNADPLHKADVVAASSGVISRVGQAIKRIFVIVLRIFYGEPDGRGAYYIIFLGGAVLITALMIATTWGGRLSATFFGGINMWILARVAEIPSSSIEFLSMIFDGPAFRIDISILSKSVGWPALSLSLSHIDDRALRSLGYGGVCAVIVLLVQMFIGPEKFSWRLLIALSVAVFVSLVSYNVVLA